MKTADSSSNSSAPRAQNLACSLKHLIDEIIHVFPEGADDEEAEIEGRICLRLLEQAQRDAASLFEALQVAAVHPLAAERSARAAASADRMPCHIALPKL